MLPGPRPSGGGGFTLSINRSSSPGGNTRTFILGRPGQTDIGPDRVMPLTEYVAATIRNVDWSDQEIDSSPRLLNMEAEGPWEMARPPVGSHLNI